jgi:hypothetical protein
MKREIIFRGKSIGTGEWLYGNVQIPSKPGIGYFMWDEELYQKAVYPETIGQYTGLKDKNEKKIFEGDIVRFQVPDGTIRHFVIEWADEDRILKPLSDFVPDGSPIRISGWCFNWRGYRLYPTVIDGVPDNEVMEIVGNVHDNPELI